jgi:hypothetical protein
LARDGYAITSHDDN